MHNMEHEGHEDHHAHMLADFKKRFIVSMILTVPVLILSPAIQGFLGFEIPLPGSEYILFFLSAVVYFYGGYPFLKGFFDEMKARSPGMMTLIAVAITVAFLYSSAVVFGLSGKMFFWELVTLIDVMLLGHWLEMRSVMGASRALEELIKIMPSEAHLLKGEEVTDVHVDELRTGDMVLIKPGEKVPVDGHVVKGKTSINEAMLTGESLPVSKNEGDEVIGGSVNEHGSIQVEVEKTGKDTYLNQVIELVRNAQESRSRTQDLANRAALVLTIISLSVGALTLAGWLYLGSEFVFALERSVTVMVITCPHALGLAIPLVVAVSTSLAANSGLLIRERQAFESARNVQAIVFDKTGTLTQGIFGVTDIVALAEVNEDDVLRLAASLESNSSHPLAVGIVNSAKEMNLDLKSPERFNSIPGKGIEGFLDGRNLKVVSPVYLHEKKINAINDEISNIEEKGRTVVFLLENDKAIGALGLADQVRAESKDAIERLKSMDIKCMMLTGDNEFVARQVSGELGLDEYFAGVLPHQKAETIQEVQEEYVVAMVGDGVNDAPALVRADVGIAIGAGTDVAVESADIVLVKSDPRNVADVIMLSRKTYSKMFQNLLWATGYNAFAIPLAAGVLFGYGILLSPAAGALLMSLSTVIVAINAKTLKM
ncbi:copper-translocating P-type ATPase [Methanolobus sp. ZRKC2]|uniref:copper-translocating P-type ATPase n=1 Tax=Methanolobus sp. ZRKC2 TaxID=3125783 RepID=UPI00325467B9